MQRLTISNKSNLLFVAIPAFLFIHSAVAQTIQTIAGGGPVNLPALSIGLPQPSGVAVDMSGNLFVSIARLNQIWKITPSGSTSVVAGIAYGSYGFGGPPFYADGVPALNATLFDPGGLAIDRSGNLYVADTTHFRVRKISPAGIISTVAGTGVGGFSGDGGPASSAKLNFPTNVAVDSLNNIYIVDRQNQRIRVVDPSGIINTFAGNGTPTFSGDGGPATSAGLNIPTAVAVDSSSAVYICDAGNSRVRKVVNGNITTVAGTGTNGESGDNGPATSAQLNNPIGVTVDHFDNLFILQHYRIREMAANSSIISAYAGTGQSGYNGDGGPPTSASFGEIAALAFDPTGVSGYVSDSGTNPFFPRIRKISASVVSTFAGNNTVDYEGDSLPAANVSVLGPKSVAADDSGSLYFIDSGNFVVRKLALNTGVLNTFVGSGTSGVYTSDNLPALGNPTGDLEAFSTSLNGTLYLADRGRIRIVANGTYRTIAGDGTTYPGDGGPASATGNLTPTSFAFAPNGDIYVAEANNSRVRLINGQTGIITTIAGSAPPSLSSGDGGLAVNANLYYPYSISLDGLGNLFVAETGAGRIRKIVLATNIITTVAGDGSPAFADGVLATQTGLAFPSGVFADESGNLFIADQGNSRVRKISVLTGLISTVAGDGRRYFNGDGGPATLASIDPQSITLDRSQNLYIADGSGRIRTTTVQACFFTPSFSNLNLNSGATTGSIMVSATNANCPYTVASNSPYLTITSGATGMGSGTVTYSLSANVGATPRTATIAAAAHNLTITQAPGLLTNADSVSPSSGSGTSQNFSAVFSSTGGVGNLASEQILINGTLNNTAACSIYVNSAGFYLFNDAGTALAGPAQSGTLSNNQCTLTVAGSSVSSSGNTRTVSVSLSFFPSFGGTKNIYLLATDLSGNTSGFQNRGTYTLPLPITTPTADSTTPSSGSGSTQTFTAVYSDPNGFSNLTSEQFLINSTLSNVNACSLYVNSLGFYLFTDDGSQLLGPAAPGGTLVNSYCTFSMNGSSVTGTGNSRTVTFNLSFSPAFSGTKSLFLLAANRYNNTSGFQNRGTYSVPVVLTTPGSVTFLPYTIGGFSNSFLALYRDAGGFNNLTSEQLLINSSLSNVNACSLYVNSSGFYLFNDAGTVLMGPATPGGTLVNSQCTFFLTGSRTYSYSQDATLRAVVYNLTFSSSFTGTKNFYLYDTNLFNINSGFQNGGTFPIPLANPSLTVDSISPNTGSGTSQAFTAIYSYTGNFANIATEQLIINSSLSNINACSLYVNDSGFFLFNDAGTVLMGPATQGGSLNNSQCTFSMAGSSATGSAHSRSITFNLNFAHSFAGAKSLYLLDSSSDFVNSGFQNRGTFTVQ